MLKITPIASSSSGNCFLLDNGTSRFFLEAGVSLKTVRQKAGHSVSSAAGCLCSHFHADHSGKVREFFKMGIDCFMSAETAEAIGVTGDYNTKIVKAGQQFTIPGGWTVKAFDVQHLNSDGSTCEGALGFLISTGEDKILFLTDLAYCRYYFKGVTHLMIEANFCEKILAENVASGAIDPARRKRLIDSHMSIQRVLDMLHKMDKSALREIHLIHLSSANSDEESFKRLVQETIGVPVYVAGA